MVIKDVRFPATIEPVLSSAVFNVRIYPLST